MSEQLQSKMVEILAGIQAAAKSAGDFALEQLPDIAQSYVAYGRAMHSTGAVAGAIVLLSLLLLARKMMRAIGNDEFWPIPVCMVGGMVGALLLASNLSQAMLVWFAPKVWLLRELAALVK